MRTDEQMIEAGWIKGPVTKAGTYAIALEDEVKAITSYYPILAEYKPGEGEPAEWYKFLYSDDDSQLPKPKDYMYLVHGQLYRTREAALKAARDVDVWITTLEVQS